MKIAYYESHRDRAPVCVDATWDDVDALVIGAEEVECDHSAVPAKECEKKYGTAWSPVEFDGDGRSDENVVAIHALVLDLDGMTDDEAATAFERLDGLRFAAHTTHSHAPGAACFRVAVELSRPVLRSDWPAFWQSVTDDLALPKLDVRCKNPARIYFLPRVARGSDGGAVRGAGRPIDVDDVLRDASRAAAPRAATDAPDLPLPLSPAAVDLGELAECLRRVAYQKVRQRYGSEAAAAKGRASAAALHRVLDGKKLAHPGGFTGDAGGLPVGRDDELNRVMAVIAHAVPAGTPWVAVAEVVRPSVAATAGVGPKDDVDHWMAEAEDMYRRAAARRREYEDANDELRVRNRKAYESLFLKKKALESSTPEQPLDVTWMEQLQRDGKKCVRSNGTNVAIILANAPETKDCFRWNTVLKTIEVSGPFAECDVDVLGTEVSDWLGAAYDVHVSDAVAWNRVLAAALRASYNPIREHLNGLPPWDGTSRVDDWLIRYVGAETTNADGKDISPWVRQVGRLWMVGLVARGCDPGTQVDSVIVLEGGEGAGKSSLARSIAAGWCCEDFNKGKLTEKDEQLKVLRSWVTLFDELAGGRRADQDAVKAFLTRRVDNVRLPFGRMTKDYPRQTVFLGTTNDEDDYLPDLGTNRRYWPVRCGYKLDVDGFRRVRDQVVAEALAIYRGAMACPECAPLLPGSRCPEHRWWLEREESEAFSADVTATRVSMPEDILGAVASWWRRQSRSVDRVTMGVICDQALQVKVTDINPGMRKRVGWVLKRLGFVRKRDADGWHYVAPKSHLKIVEGEKK